MSSRLYQLTLLLSCVHCSAIAATRPAATAVASALQATLWQPGCISSAAQETSVALHPHGHRAWFMRGDFSSTRGTVLEARLDSQDPQRCDLRIAGFSGRWRDSEPHLSADGRRLYFVSNRPLRAGGPPVVAEWNGRRFPGAQLWFVALDAHGEPTGPAQRVGGAANQVPMVYNPSTTANGDLYFSSHRPDSGPGYQIYRALWNAKDGAHGEIERLDLGPIERNRMDPAISPDGRLLVYAGDEGDSQGAADLYAVWRTADGGWSAPRHLPAPVNSAWLENAPGWGEEDGVLYFSSARPAAADPAARPETLRSLEALEQSLRDPLNGSRNLWRVDLRDWLRAHEASRSTVRRDHHAAPQRPQR